MKTDAQIQQDVLRELKWDTRVEETDVGVEVDKGVVTLTGTVATYVKRHAAQEAAHRVAGVQDVANDVKVIPPGSFVRTDTEIAQAVRHALESDVVVPDARIKSTVSNGWVTLEGTVDTAHEHMDAERAVRHLAGVRSLFNNIIINAPRLKPETIREEIEEALERRADRQAKRIQVSVNDGLVELSGPVYSWAEREAVVAAARFTPGVRKVEDHLRREPVMM